jgi:hypothetical protein
MDYNEKIDKMVSDSINSDKDTIKKKLRIDDLMIEYLKRHNKNVNDIGSFLPIRFMNLEDYDFKYKILKEAIDKNILIEETELYLYLEKDNFVNK